jgi:outer membrane cobalamin receptor
MFTARVVSTSIALSVVLAARLAAQAAATPLAEPRVGQPAAISATQPADSGVVRVTVRESMGMLSGFRVQSPGKWSFTDSTGVAQITLGVGPRVINVTRMGFKSVQLNVTVVRDSIVPVVVTMEMGEMAMELAEVKVSAARTGKLAGETPVRVEVVDEMEVDEKTLMAPSGIAMLLNETPGLKVQAAAPGLGTGGVRILGLPGQYTVMLADGLPLYGGSASALGPLDISPVDLQRVEIIKGAASSLYGGQSLGGVINLVSKAPTGAKEMLLNRRSLSVTDAATWLSHRMSSTTGVSLLASGTTQGSADLDNDGWADQARARRWNVRPRLSRIDSHGRSLFVTAGYGYDDRLGGTLGSARAPNGAAFREGLRSNRADIGATASLPTANGGTLAFRLAMSGNWREREFGAGPRERDRASTAFAEATRSFNAASATTVVGAALQIDAFHNALNDRFDHTWTSPGVFVTVERPVGPLTVSASVRGDAHEGAGNQLTERLALLAKLAGGWSVRGSAGTGFAPPAVTTEETDAVGLRAITADVPLRAEKSRGVMLDVNGHVAHAELLLTAYYSAIRNGIRLRDDMNHHTGGATLLNAEGSARVGGVEALAVWRFSGGKFIGNYGYARGSRPDVMDATHTQRELMPMLNRHRVGGDLMLEREKVYRLGIEGTWFGAQPLDDTTYRSESKPYVYMMAIAARQFGALEVVANFENLLNVRQTRTDPLVRPTPTAAGRWTTDAWAPLEGFMANVAVRYRWR